jgi:hypothetical protein
MVRMPKTLITAAEDIRLENPGFWRPPNPGSSSRAIPTSIDLLSPNSPALELLAYRPAPQQVHFHSIIGVYQGKGTESHDGVVQYPSAHIEGVDSEYLVPAHHIGIHHHPRAILEIRRILHRHLRELEEANRIIVPVQWQRKE